MKRALCTLVLITSLTLAIAQEQSTIPDGEKTGNPYPVKVYSGEAQSKKPVLIEHPAELQKQDKCKEKLSGETSFFLIVDVDGRPHNITFDKPAGTVIDKLAIQLVDEDRFTPAMLQNSPVASSLKIEMRLNACLSQSKNESGKETFQLGLISSPEQKISWHSGVPSEATFESTEGDENAPVSQVGVPERITPPHAIYQPEAKYTDAARKHHIEGTCVVQAIVDKHGMPDQVHIVGKLDPGLDENAIIAVEAYRFTPAMREGVPIAVPVNIEVKYRLR